MNRVYKHPQGHLKHALIIKYVLGLLIISSIGCNEDEMEVIDEGVELNANWDLEEGDPTAPTNWGSTQTTDNFILEYSSEEAFSGTKSIKITHPETSGTDDFAAWHLTIPFDGELNAGKRVTLRTKVKGNLSGRGASLGLVGWNGPERVTVVTTPLHMPFIIGELDWEEFSVFSVVDQDVKRYVLLLGMESSSGGTIYFDDVTLTLTD